MYISFFHSIAFDYFVSEHSICYSVMQYYVTSYSVRNLLCKQQVISGVSSIYKFSSSTYKGSFFFCISALKMFQSLGLSLLALLFFQCLLFLSDN